jgi:hypothetical protein
MEQFAKDEGPRAALDKLERWRDCLEEMQEICQPAQVGYIVALHCTVREAIKNCLYNYPELWRA